MAADTSIDEDGLAGPLVVMTGPTASGKSHCALALSDCLPIEIVTMDSAQIYRGMDIGTAKPTLAEQAAVPHHLIDLIDPTEQGSAARFVEDARQAFRAIRSRGKVPVLVGGTMLYLKALREGLSALPPADRALRRALEADAQSDGWPALHARLATLDPVSAARLDPNDAQRIQRALEICLLSGEPMSALLQRPRAPLPDMSRWVQIALAPADRGVLHERIAQRFDRMLTDGLVDELDQLRRHHPLHAELPSMRCVGYRQAWQYLDGAIDRTQLREHGIHATRQLAKRQLTWLRTLPDLATIDCLRQDLVATVRDSVLTALRP